MEKEITYEERTEVHKKLEGQCQKMWLFLLPIQRVLPDDVKGGGFKCGSCQIMTS